MGERGVVGGRNVKNTRKKRNCSRYIIKVQRTATAYGDVLCRRVLGCREWPIHGVLMSNTAVVVAATVPT